ncbi:pyruvate carboxyl transferase [Algibacter lectus]|uniref:Pyruvate carboxyl transferase n=1 Tax=Algibacter lectus TaxID=221126 RepID=A0A090W737_9FLAO|nr:pyruvate carboxyl transferase [Algibacter lectus]
MPFLDNILKHETFRQGKVTVNFIKANPDLFIFKAPRNRATKLITYLGDVIVNGNPDVKKIDHSKTFIKPKVPKFDPDARFPEGTKDLLSKLGPEKFSQWLMNEKKSSFYRYYHARCTPKFISHAYANLRYAKGCRRLCQKSS